MELILYKVRTTYAESALTTVCDPCFVKCSNGECENVLWAYIPQDSIQAWKTLTPLQVNAAVETIEEWLGRWKRQWNATWRGLYVGTTTYCILHMLWPPEFLILAIVDFDFHFLGAKDRSVHSVTRVSG